MTRQELKIKLLNLKEFNKKSENVFETHYT